MDYKQVLPDGSEFYGLDLSEYIRAINNAPPGTLIMVGELTPEPWVRCLGCGAEMTENLKDSHTC